MTTLMEGINMTNLKQFSNKVKFVFFSALIVAFSLSTANAQADGSQQNVVGKVGTFAITNARIVTVSGAVIENGTVVIKDGKILSVAAGGAPPKGAEIIDGKGLSVYPGMIDSNTNLGLAEITLSADPTVDVAEVGDNNANAKAIVGINPNSSHVNVTRVNGITTVLSHPTGGTIAGQSAVINLWGRTQADMAIVSQHSLVINFPRITTFGGFGGGPSVDFNEAIRQRDRRLDALKKYFTDAKEYARVKEAAAKDPQLPKTATNLQFDAMLPFVRGEKPIIFVAERERDIRAVAKFVEENKLKGLIAGGQDAWMAADVLKKNNIAVLYTNIYALPVQEDEAYDHLFEAPAKMLKAGVKFAIATGDNGGEVRDLPYHAGLASAYGLPKDEALKAVTLYPAQILGVADQIGSIEAGKVANLVVTDGDILEPRTNIRHLFINGRLIPLTSRHTELFERFKEKR
jgi:imidazolonepropionase-like amidohydrolase